MSMRPTLELLYERGEIAKAVTDLAGEIRGRYAGKDLVVVGVLKGAFMFLSDLVRALDLPVEVDFIWLTSYGKKRYASGEVRIKKDLETSIAGRHVLVVEDIVDTGVTLRFLIDHLRQRGPASVSICALIDKPRYRMTPVELDFVGFELDEGYVVGYGLDDGEKYRELPDILRMPEEKGIAP